MSREEVWRPLPGSQETFLTCPIFEALFDGTRGSGKTEALLVDFAQHCGEGFGSDWRGIIFRRTYKQLSDIIAKSRSLFHKAFPEAKFNKSEMTWSWPSGEELLLRYMDDPEDYWQYHGHEYSFVAFDELTNWSTLECYQSMKSCCRSTRENMPRKYRATANPWGRGHNAVKEYFVDPAPAGEIMVDEEGLERVRIHGSWRENRILLSSDPEYPARIASAASSDGQRRAWLNGDWDVQIGGMFDDLWTETGWPKHWIEPFEIPASWRVDRSFDWGSAKPYCIQWWAESDGSEVELANGDPYTFPRGTLFLVREFYGWTGDPDRGTGESTHAIAKRIKRIEEGMSSTDELIHVNRVAPGPADTQIWNRDGGRCINDDFRMAGVRWIKANKGGGTRILGWQLLRDRLKASLETPMEKPGLFVFRTCSDGLRRTIRGVQRDEKNPDDIEKDAEDHALDAARYRVLMKTGSRIARRL